MARICQVMPAESFLKHSISQEGMDLSDARGLIQADSKTAEQVDEPTSNRAAM